VLRRATGTAALLFLLAAPLRGQAAVSPADTLPPDRWLAPDKPAHVFAGYFAAGATWGAADRLGADRSERRAAALASGIGAGILKEAFDRWVQDERFSWKDLVADAAGIALFLAVSAAAES